MIELYLPFPSRQLHPNGRPPNWAVRSRLVSERRALVKDLATIAEVVPSEPLQSATVDVLLLNKTARKQDADNALAWLKSTIDGLVDAGIFADDNELTYKPVRQDKASGDLKPVIYLCISTT